jgi:hypothetical protein
MGANRGTDTRSRATAASPEEGASAMSGSATRHCLLRGLLLI